MSDHKQCQATNSSPSGHSNRMPDDGTSKSKHWLQYQSTELSFYIPLDTKRVISETFHKPMSWPGIEKLNLNQKHTFTNKKILQHKMNTKTKARFSRLLRHLAWKWRGTIFILVLNKFVIYLLRHLPTYLQPWTHTEQIYNKTRMWANAQPAGRPAEHRWRPLFNAAKFG